MNQRLRLLAALLSLMVFPVTIFAQRIVFDSSVDICSKPGFQVEWDSESQRMIAYRDTSEPACPSVRVLSSSGSNVTLYPLKDFPGANYIDIWAVTGSATGEVIISATLGYGPRNTRPIPIKSLLLSYDATGTLRKVWNVDPYLHHHVAADSVGNVFALGEKGGASGGDYPLLIKYSPTGEVLGETLSTGLFSSKDAVVVSGSPNGEAKIFIKKDHLLVWIAATQELFTFSLDGVLLSRSSFSSAIQQMVDLSGGTRVRVLEVGVDSNQGIVFQVLLRQKLPAKAKVALARVTPDGSFENWIEPSSDGDVHRFLGLTADDKNVFLEKVSQKTVAIDLNRR